MDGKCRQTPVFARHLRDIGWRIGLLGRLISQNFTTRLYKFDMVNHIVGIKHLDDEHQPTDRRAHWRLLRRIDNANVMCACGVQPGKIGILSKNISPLRQRKGEMFFVGGRTHPSFLNRQHVYSSAAQTLSDGCGHMFIHVESNLLAHKASPSL